jgi:hypothetical protein
MQQIVFNPASTAQFSFNCLLDGQNYTINIPFNAYRQDYYFNIYDVTNNLVLSKPLIGSPLNSDINLLKEYFVSTMVFRQPTQTFEINP